MPRGPKYNKKAVRQPGTLDPLPFPIVRVGERRPAAGWFLSSIAWVIILSCITLWAGSAGFLVERHGFPGFVLWVAILGAFFIIVLPRAVRLIARGRRMRARRAADILSHDNRAPVVLLRSFEDDDLIDPSFPATYQIVPGRYENRLIKAIAAVGPAVALGRPGESEPELGAGRLYVEDKDWRHAISYLMKHAEAVVAVVGRSSGLWWEIELALAQVAPERLLFFFPFPVPKESRTSFLRSTFLQNPVFGKWLRRKAAPAMEAEREKRYEVFRERFGTSFKSPLPPTLAGARFLHMDSVGLPQRLPPARPSFLVRLATMNFKSWLDIPFTKELRPFVEKLEGLK